MSGSMTGQNATACFPHSQHLQSLAFIGLLILSLGLLRDAHGFRASFSAVESRAPERRFPLLSGSVSYFAIFYRLGLLYSTAWVFYTKPLRFAILTLCGFLAFLWRVYSPTIPSPSPSPGILPPHFGAFWVSSCSYRLSRLSLGLLRHNFRASMSCLRRSWR